MLQVFGAGGNKEEQPKTPTNLRRVGKKGGAPLEGEEGGYHNAIIKKKKKKGGEEKKI